MAKIVFVERMFAFVEAVEIGIIGASQEVMHMQETGDVEEIVPSPDSAKVVVEQLFFENCHYFSVPQYSALVSIATDNNAIALCSSFTLSFTWICFHIFSSPSVLLLSFFLVLVGG